MNDERWQEVKDIFNSAVGLDGLEREEYLESACANDPELRRRVEGLIDSYDSDFMEAPIGNRREQNAGRLVSGAKIGRYEIIDLLGAGGMGEVYLARDTTLGRNVCLKVLSSDTPGTEAFIDRFVREAQSASALNHPNICTIYEIITNHDRPLIAMEYIEGKTLADLVVDGPLDAEKAIEITQQIAEGLAEAHEAGIVHRDIKPTNIIINKRGQVKIIDFGLAKKFIAPPDEATQKQLTHSGLIVGTVSYMSPEQVRAKEVDASTDIWGLGVLLYQMLAGKLPFTGATTSDIIAAILRSEPEFNSDAEQIPPPFENALRNALAKDKGSRYRSVRELSEDLRKARSEMLQTHPSGARSDKTTIAFPIPTKDLETTGSLARKPVNRRRFIAVAILVAAIAIAGLGSGVFRYFGANHVKIESIAVMPFENVSGTSDAEYLSDGLTESLIGRLSTLPGITVKARSSVFRYKGANLDPRAVGADLGVQALLNGRVVKKENDFTLYVELVDSATGNVLWKQPYNRPMSNLVSVQSEIVHDVLTKLQLKLSGAELNKATRNYTDNAEAYQLYLKGRYYWDKRNNEAYKVADDAYNQAIKLDPNYALAYAGLADLYLFRGGDRYVAMPLAKQYAVKALEIDESLAEAHNTLAFVNENYDFDMPAAEAGFKRAIELKPTYAVAHQFYAGFLMQTGRPEEGLAEAKRAVELEPYSAALNWYLGMLLGYARLYDDAIAQQQKTLQIQPGFALSEGALASTYVLTGRYDNATALIQKGLRSEEQGDRSLQAIIFQRTGRQKDARLILDKMVELCNKPCGNTAYGIARFYTALGERDEAIRWLNIGYDRRIFNMFFLRVDPFFESLNGDPRFDELIRRMGLRR